MSTLCLGYADFQAEAAIALGLTATEANWTVKDKDLIDRCINDAYRMFLNPPPDPRSNEVHVWSFLVPTRSFDLWPTTSLTVSGVPTYDPVTGLSTITATTGVFYLTMEGRTIAFTDSGNEYTIADYVSLTQIKVTGDASGELSDDTASIEADGNYDLPDDFGGILGPIYLQPARLWAPIKQRDAGYILSQRTLSVLSGVPTFFATRPKEATKTAQQQWELLIWPIPNLVYPTYYRSYLLQDALTSLGPYAAGGEQVSETLRALVVAQAEYRRFRTRTDAWAIAVESLQLLCMRDSRMGSPEELGQNTDPAADDSFAFRTNRPPLYNGEEI